jgi:uncharacterized membrane protein
MRIVIETKSVWKWTRRILALLLTWFIIASILAIIRHFTGCNMDFQAGFWMGISLCFYLSIWTE